MTREQIIARRKACDLNELAARRDHAATLQRIRTSREYVQAECQHPVTKKIFQISHHETRCEDCGAKLPAQVLLFKARSRDDDNGKANQDRS